MLPKGGLLDICFASDSNRLYGASRSSSICCWDLKKSSKCQKQILHPSGPVNSLCISSDDRLLFGGTDSGWCYSFYCNVHCCIISFVAEFFFTLYFFVLFFCFLVLFVPVLDSILIWDLRNMDALLEQFKLKSLLQNVSEDIVKENPPYQSLFDVKTHSIRFV
jgi:WD40 repeat protein